MRSQPVLIFIACVITALAIAAFLTFGVEPRYQGKTANEWARASYSALDLGSPTKQAEACEALRAMGKNAVPSLVHELSRSYIQHPYPRLEKYANRIPALRGRLSPSPIDAIIAARALGEIGPSASNAIPMLLQVSPTNWCYREARAALMKIRGEPVDPIIQQLNDYKPGEYGFVDAALTVAEFGTNARAAVPALCHAITMTNVSFTQQYLQALHSIHSNPEICVPALVEFLQKFPSQPSYIFSVIGKRWALRDAMLTLAMFGRDASSSVPILRNYISDPDPLVDETALQSLSQILPPEERKTLVPGLLQVIHNPQPVQWVDARKLLKEIDPEAAAKAGVK